MKLIFRITVLLLLVALLVSVLIRNKQQITYESASAKKIVTEIPVETMPVKMARKHSIIRSAGIVESSEELVVISTVQGAVKSIDAFVGKSVKQGDLLLTADDYFAKKEYEIAREAYEQLKKDFDRYRELSTENAVSGQQLEQLKVQLDGAETKQSSLQRRLEDTRIKAPVDGIINQVFVKKGGVLGNGSPVCEIVNPSGLKITAHVSESDLEWISKGQRITLFENSGIGNSCEGVVAGLGVKPDRTGLYPINITLSAVTKSIKPGMVLNAEIPVTSASAILIPKRIISISKGDVRGVYISENNRAVFREINTGKVFNDSVEVISGIEEGQYVITNGYQLLYDGAHLKIVKERL